jgi:hypothetical protein
MALTNDSVCACAKSGLNIIFILGLPLIVPYRPALVIRYAVTRVIAHDG